MMAKKIIEMVRTKMEELDRDPVKADENSLMAVAAMNGGIRSVAWKTYMLQYVEKEADGTTPLEPAQLERLLATDGTLGQRDPDRQRAYMVGNAVCGGGSPGGTRLDFQVEGIDNTIGCI